MIDIFLHHLGLHFPYAVEAGERLLYVIVFFAIIIATTVHEFGHAWMADWLGDPTPRQQKRVTLSPFAHLDPWGTLILIASTLIGYPIGWGKPVRTNPENFTRCSPKRGMGLVAAAGPLMNLLTAVLLAGPARFILAGGMGTGLFAIWLFIIVAITMLVNLSLFCFNLVPLAPLDGSHITASLLPDALSESFKRIMGQVGPIVLMVLMYSGTLGEFIGPIIRKIFGFLIGIPL